MTAEAPIATALKRTPLYDVHKQSKARLVDFAGWEMPVFYTGILEESRAVRTAVGLFDVSHMGRLRITGRDSVAFLQRLTSNDVSALTPFHAQYSLLMHPSGGIIDDIIVYRESEDAFMVVINAGNASKDIAWMEAHLFGDVHIEDRSQATAMIAVQGPSAPALVAKIAEKDELLQLGRFAYASGHLFGENATFCRTGYTGEDGFEVIVPASVANELWNRLVEGGGVACGLGARDALRIEAGYPLYGHEINEDSTPVEAGLMWATSLVKGDFIGRPYVVAMKEKGPARRLMGLVLEERIVPRQGYTIYAGGEMPPVVADNGGVEVTDENKAIGVITSGVFSPTRNHSIAMGYVITGQAKSGNVVRIGIRDKRVPATIVQKKTLMSNV